MQDSNFSDELCRRQYFSQISIRDITNPYQIVTLKSKFDHIIKFITGKRVFWQIELPGNFIGRAVLRWTLALILPAQLARMEPYPFGPEKLFLFLDILSDLMT